MCVCVRERARERVGEGVRVEERERESLSRRSPASFTGLFIRFLALDISHANAQYMRAAHASHTRMQKTRTHKVRQAAEPSLEDKSGKSSEYFTCDQRLGSRYESGAVDRSRFESSKTLLS